MPRWAKDLSGEDKKRALDLMSLIEEKHDGRVKGHGVAKGSEQRGFVAKEDAASPTASLESIVLTGLIDAKETREVATCDTPNAFVQTDMSDDPVLLRLCGKPAELLVCCAPELCTECVTVEKGKTVSCVDAIKAIHGTLVAALCFHKGPPKNLESQGFVVNPCDPCVANKMINGHQFAMVWHVDDLKCSHVDHCEVDEFIEWL